MTSTSTPSPTTCCQIDLIKLFHGGFSTGHGFLREPQSIASYAALAAIAIQANQNDQHGGQGIPNFDYALAEGVAKSFARTYTRKLREALEDYFDTDDESELTEKAIAEAGKPGLGDVKETFDGIVADELVKSGRIDREHAYHLVSRSRQRAEKQVGPGYLPGHGGLCPQPEHHAQPRRRSDALLAASTTAPTPAPRGGW